jgi:hypothetical protein
VILEKVILGGVINKASSIKIDKINNDKDKTATW